MICYQNLENINTFAFEHPKHGLSTDFCPENTVLNIIVMSYFFLLTFYFMTIGERSYSGYVNNCIIVTAQHCRLEVRKSRTHIHLMTSNRQIQAQRRKGGTERSTKSKNPEDIEDLNSLLSYYHWLLLLLKCDINSFKSDPQIDYLSVLHWTPHWWA